MRTDYISDMKKKFTSTDIARSCGISQTTVSRVLNNHSSVDPRTRESVLACARAHGYPIRGKRGKLRIGIILSRYAPIDGYQSMALNALKDAVYRRGHDMEIIFHEDLEALNDHPVSGAIALTGDDTLNRRWAEATVLPLIRFGARSCRSNGIYSVFSDESTLVERAVRELHKAGHSKIALFLRRSRAKDLSLAENVTGPFRKAMREAGAPEKDIRISYGQENVSMEERVDLLLGQKISALIVIPGDTALEVCGLLKKRGLKIPDDISVISREYDHVLEYHTPPLTAMRPDYETMSETALSMLETILSDPSAVIKDARIPGRFILRQSVRAGE